MHMVLLTKVRVHQRHRTVARLQLLACCIVWDILKYFSPHGCGADLST